MSEIDAPKILRALVMLSLANGTPVLAKKLFGRWLDQPLDGGLQWWDGRWLFGPSKTVRGVVASLVACTLGALFLRIDLLVGAAFGLAAMAGDLSSSFVKRRLGIAPSARAIGLDHIPEALLPTLLASRVLSLDILEIAISVLVFWLGSVWLSPVFYRIGLRDRPH